MADKETDKSTGGTKGAGAYENPQWRHWFMLILSVAVIAIVLIVSYKYGHELSYVEKPDAEGAAAVAAQAKNPLVYLIPYFTNFAGVLLFIMNTSRKKRAGWQLRNFWGDHCFRVAQSCAYLFIVLWAWNYASKGGAVGDTFPPNIIGFLVGFFILRVERAMEGLGDKFEEARSAILPRAMMHVSAEEKRRQQVKLVYKVDDIATQYDVLRSQLDDRAARDHFDKTLDDAQKALTGEDPEQLKKTVNQLFREFDDVKKSAGEVLVPIEDLLIDSGKKK